MRLRPGWWALILIVFVVGFVVVTSACFAGAFTTTVPVIVTAERSGIILEPNAMVKMRGVEVGKVGKVESTGDGARVTLELFSDQLPRIPANVVPEIASTTAFGAKFVNLVVPEHPSSQRLAAGAELQVRNVATEVNTVFENVVELIGMIDPAKLNGILTAVAEALRGQGERIGAATTGLNEVLQALNDRHDLIRADWQAFKGFNDTYAAAAAHLVTVLDAATTTGQTVVDHAQAFDALLLSVAGFGGAGADLLERSKDDFNATADRLEPTIALLREYSPTYTCLLQGSQFLLENGAYDAYGGADRRSLIFDVGLLLGNDLYEYPRHLPVVAAKGGPGGKPGCGSLPDVAKNFPVRKLITNTGWGTGVDIRPNPGIGTTCAANWFPVTRAVPVPPDVRKCLPGPAIGPVPYPGAPPYGAPMYGPGGVPLWPGVPPAGPEPGPAHPDRNGQTP
jgi:phospholipid/cholesterol/gamma-HCH transport system substrate-binding protein